MHATHTYGPKALAPQPPIHMPDHIFQFAFLTGMRDGKLPFTAPMKSSMPHKVAECLIVLTEMFSLETAGEENKTADERKSFWNPVFILH